MATFTTRINQVESLYVGYFGRAADPAGENYWVGQLNAGTATLSQMAAAFATQAEATSKYPYLANPNISDPGAFVDQVYMNLFNHVADAAGKAYWVAQLQAAGGNPAAVGAMILNIISGSTGTDDTIIHNKVDVATDFTLKVSNAGITWSTGAAAQSSGELATVNETAASVTSAKGATDVYIAFAPGPQQNFTLGVDTPTSNAQNANFNAPLIFNAPTGTLVQSLRADDSAVDTAPLMGPGLSNGGTFTAMLNAAGVVPLVTLRGIPTHTVTTTAAAGYSGTITGLVNLNNVSSAGSLTVGALGAGIDAGGKAGTTTTGATLLGTVNIANVTGTTATAATTVFVHTAALAGAEDILAINVAGTFGTGPTTLATANTVAVRHDTSGVGIAHNAYEIINLAAAGQTNIALADAGSGILSTTTINVASLGGVTLWSEATEAHFTKLTTINASAQVGGLTVTGASSPGGLLTGSVLTSFKGGLGVDSVDLSSMTAAQLSAMTTGNLDGGIGRDTLILSTAQGATTTTVNDTGFEIIGLIGGSLTMDFSRFGTGIDTIRLLGLQTAANTFNNLSSGLTFDLSPIGLGAFHNGFPENFNAAGTSVTDTISVNFANLATVGKFTTTGFEVVTTTMENFAGGVGWGGLHATASPGAAVTHNLIDNQSGGGLTIAAENIGAGGTLNITGSGTSTIAFTAAPVLGALNASGYGTGLAPTSIGVLYLAAATSAQSFLGTAGRDIFIGSPAADIVNGGAGNDTVQNMATGAGGVGVADVITTGAGIDNVIIRGDVNSGALPAVYSTVTNVTDMTVGTGGVDTTDWISVSATAANYAAPGVIGTGGLRATGTAQGAWTVQSLTSSAGANAIANAGNELVKLTTAVSSAATFQTAFNAAIGTTTITGATADGSYFFTLYDATAGRMDVGIVNASSGTNTIIESGDVVGLVASANMSAADYANITASHFSVV